MLYEVITIDKLTTSFPPAFDVFDPVKKVNLEAANEGRSGSVTFEYTAIPRHAGDFEVPPFSFSYFDIQSQSYKTLQSQSFSIQVAKSAGDTTTVVSSNLSKEDVELLGSDIRFIKSTTRLHRADYYIFGQPYFYAVYLLSLLLLLALVLIRREHIRRSADKVKLRNRNVITSYSIHYTKLYDRHCNIWLMPLKNAVPPSWYPILWIPTTRMPLR